MTKLLLHVATAAALTTALLSSDVAAMDVYSQPLHIAADNNLGPYASRDRSLMSDPFETKAWDNFTLSSAADINGIKWVGAYVEPFATGAGASIPETDFEIEILADVAGVPVGLLHRYTVWGGVAGVDDANVRTTPLGHTAEFGGPVFAYDAALPTTHLPAGNYWLSITAQQTFPSADPVIDPTWQWHLGTNPAANGFYSYDDVFDDAGDSGAGLVDGSPFLAMMHDGSDLAFTLRGVPEPGGHVLAILGCLAFGQCHRRRR